MAPTPLLLGLLALSQLSWAGPNTPRPAPTPKATTTTIAPTPTPKALQLFRQPNGIKELQIDLSRSQVISEPFGEEKRTVVKLRGTFTKKDWSLVYGNESIPLQSDGTFALSLVVTDKDTWLDLVSVGPRGETQRERARLFLPTYVASSRTRTAAKQLFVSPGVSYSVLTYDQSDLGTRLSMTALTAKVAATYFFPPSIDIGFSAYYAAVPLTSSNSDFEARFLGVNARIGYVLPFVREPWRLSLLGGLYYTTMTTRPIFGFRDLMGPQLFPAVRWMLSPRNSASAYFKFSPVTDGFDLMSATNREIAFGAAFRHVLASGKSLSLGLDLSRLDLVIDRVAIRVNTVSFGLSLGL